MIKGNVLLVDDDKDIVESMEIHLKNEGLKVYKAYDGIEALEILLEKEIHLILMDIMMPRMDGLSATLKIREEKNIPIILVSAKTEDSDKIIGLNMGADDYITKPFNPLELVARVKSNLRRYISLGNFKQENLEVLKYEALVLDNASKEVSVDGEVVKLTPIEYKILEMLLKNQGRVFSSRQIYESIWQEPGYNCDRTVAVHIRRIREKIEINPKDPKYIKVVWELDIKLIKNKNLVIIVICFCITIITANIDMKDFYMKYINADFYKSYELEQVLYEIATQSVYTVVGDNASEKMLDYRTESRNMISNYTTANVFVINNDSKEVYYNNISDIDKYLKTVTKSYHNVYEINFKDKTMYLLNGNNDKVRVSTNYFGNLAQTRKEDVTTYIAIPFTSDIIDMKDININEPLYVRYKEFTKNIEDASFFIGFKMIALAIIIISYLVISILENKELNKKIF